MPGKAYQERTSTPVIIIGVGLQHVGNGCPHCSVVRLEGGLEIGNTGYTENLISSNTTVGCGSLVSCGEVAHWRCRNAWMSFQGGLVLGWWPRGLDYIRATTSLSAAAETHIRVMA
jgi:hypothetical protein